MRNTGRGNTSVADIMRQAMSDPRYQADSFFWRVLKRMHEGGRMSQPHSYALWQLYNEGYPVEKMIENFSNVEAAYVIMTEGEAAAEMDRRGYEWAQTDWMGNDAPRWDKKGWRDGV